MEHYWFVGIWCILQYIGQGRGQSSECSTYTTINDPTRKDTYSGSDTCDNGLQTKWYRFITPGSTMMPVTCVSYNYCGTFHAGWLSGQHPSVAQGIVTRKVCYSLKNFHSYGCCEYSNNIRVRNCGQFYVYELKAPPTCNFRYCTTATAITDYNDCTSGTHNCDAKSTCQTAAVEGFTCVVSKAVFCLVDSFGISVAINISSHDGERVTLKDTSCIPTTNATHYLLSTAFRECGSISNETGNHVIVSNEVIISDASNGVITRWDKIVIPFSCRYRRSDLEASLKSFQPTINSSIHAREDGFGNFSLNINMARSVRFDSYYNSYPVNARLNDRLFIQVSLNANSTDFVLLIEECYTTPTGNKNDATKYTMIEKMCPTDSTLQFHSGEMHHKKFSFLAFNFLNNTETIYLHCGVYLCHKSSKVARCTSGCGINKVPSRKKRDVHKREIDDPDYTSTYVLDTGAIRKAKENKGKKGASLSSVSTTTIVLGVAVGIFCLLSVSFIIMKTIKRKRANYIKRKQSQTALSFGKQGMDNKAVEMDPCT